MRIVNLTGHPVEVLGPDGGTLRLPASDSPLRLVEHAQEAASLTADGVVIARVLVEVETPAQLPPAVDDVLYVVPQLVARSLPDREDLVYPYDLIRDSDGRIIGARALATAVAR